MTLPVSIGGVALEKKTALLDAKWVIDERGDTIEFYERTEDEVTRDKYNSIKRKNMILPATKTMNAFPIQFNPIDKDMLKAGIRERVDVIIYTAMQDWMDIDIDPRKIDMSRSSVVLREETYKIKDKGLVNHFSDTFLNVTLGLVLR